MMFSIVIVATCPSWWAYQVTHSLLWSGVIAALTTLTWMGWGLWKIRANETYTFQTVGGWVSFEAIGAQLGPDTITELQDAGLSLAGIDMYRAPDLGAVAIATGRHSIALENALVERIKAGAVSPLEVAALIAHEMGHLESARVTRDPWLAWLTLPSIGVARVIRGHIAKTSWSTQERGGFILFLTFMVLSLAALIAHTHPAWFLIGIAATFVWATLFALHARAHQTEEFQADQFAQEHGFGPELAKFLDHLHEKAGPRLGPSTFRSHPPLPERVARLNEMDAQSAGSD